MSAMPVAVWALLALGTVGTTTGGAATGALASAPTRGGAARAAVMPVVPPPLPPYLLHRLRGDTVSLRAFAGRVLVINAWGTWCPPCVAELASLEALADSLAPEGVEFLAISAEREEVVAPWVRARRLGLPVYLELTPMPAPFDVQALPTTWILDRAGRIRLVHRGARNWDRPAVRTLLRTLLAEDAPVPAHGGGGTG